ncbi:HepT-like ribonuclease domain-containing protein [Peloplasma aerotolerans]
MYGFRNRIIHDYDQINMSVVYDTVKEDLPILLKQLIDLKNSND